MLPWIAGIRLSAACSSAARCSACSDWNPGWVNAAVSWLLVPGVPVSVLPIGLFSCGMAVAMPSMSLLGLEIFPERRGMASSCQSFLQIGFNAASSALVAPVLWASPLGLASGMGMFAALGLCAWVTWRRLGLRGGGGETI